MKNKKGQSLIEIVFSIGIVILVLTGVVVLVVSTTKAKTASSERERAVELSQTLIEKKVLEIKNDPLTFWKAASHPDSLNNSGSNMGTNFSGYLYDVNYKDCDSDTCKIIFTVKWGDSKTLSVERLFSRIGT